MRPPNPTGRSATAPRDACAVLALDALFASATISKPKAISNVGSFTSSLSQVACVVKVVCLVIETAFSNRERELARRSLHLSPATLAQELASIPIAERYPVYITHTKPSETLLIMDEIRLLDCTSDSHRSPHDVRWLLAGQTMEL